MWMSALYIVIRLEMRLMMECGLGNQIPQHRIQS